MNTKNWNGINTDTRERKSEKKTLGKHTVEANKEKVSHGCLEKAFGIIRSVLLLVFDSMEQVFV